MRGAGNALVTVLGAPTEMKTTNDRAVAGHYRQPRPRIGYLPYTRPTELRPPQLRVADPEQPEETTTSRSARILRQLKSAVICCASEASDWAVNCFEDFLRHDLERPDGHWSSAASRQEISIGVGNGLVRKQVAPAVRAWARTFSSGNAVMKMKGAA